MEKVKLLKPLKFWTPKESFLLLEILPEKVNGILLGLNGEKHLLPRRFWEDASWAKLAGRPDLRHLVKNIIVAADSSLAFTAVLPVSLERESASEPLSAVELENLLSQAVGKVFNSCRAEAAKLLRIDDLNIILANSRVINFRIDGHHVLNPVGFHAHRVEAVLELILTSRELFENIKMFLKNRNDFYFTEIGRAELAVLQKLEKSPLSIIRLGHFSSSYLVTEPAPVGPVLSRGFLPWNTQSIVESISKEWGVSAAVADAIYHLHLEEKISKKAAGSLKKILEIPQKNLLKAIDGIRLKGKIYIESPVPLPMQRPFRRGRYVINDIPVRELAEHFGFRLDPAQWPMQEGQLFRFLAPFWEFYFDRSDTTINRWLKRHLNWLGAPI